jgi:D-amino-acid dehydrogenase
MVSGSIYDVMVLGAGMVGTATAADLALRGVKVALVDRQGPGEGTSFGNAGIIDTAAFVPHAFPRDLVQLLKYATGATPHARVDFAYLPRLLGWLHQYWRESAPDRLEAAAARLAPLSAHAVTEHKRLAAAAGALPLIRDTGWMHLFRTEKAFQGATHDLDLMRRHGVDARVVDGAGVAAMEPHLTEPMAKGMWIADASSTSDPGALTKAYAGLVTAHGGAVITADAKGLMRSGGRWVLATEGGAVEAEQVVVALGPWAKEFLSGFEIDVPIAAKRGYHMHYRPRGNATLTRPVIDVEGGYCLTPMTKGLRMTTGAEFADRDAPPNPAQVDACEAYARKLFPLEARAEAEPWLGRRPNTPDGVPIIGAAPGQPGMWLAVGHGHRPARRRPRDRRDAAGRPRAARRGAVRRVRGWRGGPSAPTSLPMLGRARRTPA